MEGGLVLVDGSVVSTYVDDVGDLRDVSKSIHMQKASVALYSFLPSSPSCPDCLTLIPSEHALLPRCCCTHG